MDRSLESLKVAFTDWRSSKQSRSQAIPPYLWVWVCELISDTGGRGLSRLARLLSLNASKTKEHYAIYVAERSAMNHVENSSQDVKQCISEEQVVATGDENVCSEQMEDSVQSVPQSVFDVSSACEASSNKRLDASTGHRSTNKIGRKRRAKIGIRRRAIHVTCLTVNEGIPSACSHNSHECSVISPENPKHAANASNPEMAHSQVGHPCIGTPMPDFIATISFMNVSMSISSHISYTQLSEMFVSISRQVASFGEK